MQFLKRVFSKIVRFFQNNFSRKNIFPISIFFLFLLAHSFRLALFDNLLFDSSVTVFSCLQHHFGIFNKIIIFFFFISVLFWWKQPFLFIAYYVIQTIYMFVNISYHYYFDGYLHINQYVGMFGEAFDLFKHQVLPSGLFSWFIFLDFPFFVVCLFFFRNISDFFRRFIFKKPLFFIGGALICLAIYWDPLQREGTAFDIMNDAYSSDSHVIKKYGLFAFNFVDLINYKDAQSRIQSIHYGRNISLPKKDAIPPNFIFIQLESIDSYIVNLRHKNQPVTPFLDSLSTHCVFYPYVLSFHKAGSTSDCEFSILNSIEPFDDFPSIKLRNYNYPNSMLKPLIDAGYDAIAFHGNRGTYFNRNIALKKMGFRSFYDMGAMGLEEKGWGAPDGEVFNFIQNMLSTQKSPFCYYTITMSSHEPFNLMQSYFSTSAFNDIKDESLKKFFSAMNYIDCELCKFIGYIRKNTANTYIFIYGDHTPVIPNTVYKKSSFSRDAMLFEFVPCYILTPEGTIFQENHQVASFLDIAPTVLKASKVGCSYKSNGRDLLSFLKDSATIAFNGKNFSRHKLFSQIKANR